MAEPEMRMLMDMNLRAILLIIQYMCSVLSVVGLSPVDYLLKIIDKEALLDKLDAFFRSREKIYL